MNDLISSAEQFARERHEGQFRKGKPKEPCVIHLEELAKITKNWGGKENTITAAWLEEIAALFGRDVAYFGRTYRQQIFTQSTAQTKTDL